MAGSSWKGKTVRAWDKIESPTTLTEFMTALNNLQMTI